MSGLIAPMLQEDIMVSLARSFERHIENMQKDQQNREEQRRALRHEDHVGSIESTASRMRPSGETTSRLTGRSNYEGARISQFPSLMSFPDEILLLIMEHMKPATLYLTRQCSRRFMRLFGAAALSRYHKAQEWANEAPWTMFSISALDQFARIELSRVLQPLLSCAGCVEARRSATWESRLSHLRYSIYCVICRVEHPRFLFPRSMIYRQRFSGRELGKVCVGRMGMVTLCEHSGEDTQLTWPADRDLAQVGSVTRDCGHMFHWSAVENAGTLQAATMMPQLALSRAVGTGKRHIAYGWDVSIVEKDMLQGNDLRSIHAFVKVRLRDVLGAYKICSHFKHNNYDAVAQYARTGICDCFLQSHASADQPGESPLARCSCARQQYLQCAECGSSCTWKLWPGGIKLSYRYVWELWKPESCAWLNLLDPSSYEDEVFTEETRHVLWCDTLGCAGTKRRRWETMVKQNMMDQGDLWHHACTDRCIAMTREKESNFRFLDMDLPYGLCQRLPGEYHFGAQTWII